MLVNTLPVNGYEFKTKNAPNVTLLTIGGSSNQLGILILDLMPICSLFILTQKNRPEPNTDKHTTTNNIANSNRN